MEERRAGKAEKQANQAYENKQKPGKFEGIGIIKRERESARKRGQYRGTESQREAEVLGYRDERTPHTYTHPHTHILTQQELT